ncbi:MAG: DUF86 domain-containing protein [bacterium]|nr:DUF86 domain-containing protein [bacterium]
MQNDERIRLQHMRDSAQEALSFARRRTRQDLDRDRMLTLSLVKSIEIIGEAAVKVSAETQHLYPQIPWAQIVGMRNRLIHGYFDINLDRVWDTLTEDLPPLLRMLTQILNEENS